MVHARSDATLASELAATARGVPHAENALIHGVTAEAIRRWHQTYTVEGRDRGQRHLLALCPRCETGDLAARPYAELFGWYLGDGWLTAQHRGVYGLHIVNDERYPNNNLRLQNLMRKVKPGSLPHAGRRTGCVVTTTSWKHWPCLFPQHGAGRKHQRELGMTAWQWDIVAEHPPQFLRGLFHSDGCRVNNWATRMVRGERRRYEYPRWQFRNASEEILGWCGQALDLVNVAWRRSGPRTISVSRREAVLRLDDLIGLKA